VFGSAGLVRELSGAVCQKHLAAVEEFFESAGVADWQQAAMRRVGLHVDADQPVEWWTEKWWTEKSGNFRLRSHFSVPGLSVHSYGTSSRYTPSLRNCVWNFRTSNAAARRLACLATKDEPHSTLAGAHEHAVHPDVGHPGCPRERCFDAEGADWGEHLQNRLFSRFGADGLSDHVGDVVLLLVANAAKHRQQNRVENLGRVAEGCVIHGWQ
jgi:hypothetical protein